MLEIRIVVIARIANCFFFNSQFTLIRLRMMPSNFLKLELDPSG